MTNEERLQLFKMFDHRCIGTGDNDANIDKNDSNPFWSMMKKHLRIIWTLMESQFDKGI